MNSDKFCITRYFVKRWKSVCRQKFPTPAFKFYRSENHILSAYALVIMEGFRDNGQDQEFNIMIRCSYFVVFSTTNVHTYMYWQITK